MNKMIKKVKKVLRTIKNKVYSRELLLLLEVHRSDYDRLKGKTRPEIPEGLTYKIGDMSDFDLIEPVAEEYYRPTAEYKKKVVDASTIFVVKNEKNETVAWCWVTTADVPPSTIDFNVTYVSPKGWLYGFDVYISPEYRKKNLAKALYAKIFHYCFIDLKADCVYSIIASTNRASQYLAKCYGFKVTDTIDFIEILGVVVKGVKQLPRHIS